MDSQKTAKSRFTPRLVISVFLGFILFSGAIVALGLMLLRSQTIAAGERLTECKRRSNNPSLKRPVCPVAPE